MTTTEYIKLNVDEKVHSYAKIYSSLLQDEYQRKRSYASLVALYSFVGLLEQSPYSVQKSMTLFKNPQLNEQYEISDLYINEWHIDVRVVTGGDAVLVPKVHFDNDIVPDFYVVIKVDSTLKNAELVGVIETANIIKEAFDYNYYAVPFSSLIQYNTFLEKLVIEKRNTHTEEDHELFKTSYLSLLDNNLDNETKKKIIKHLFKCNICRTEFCCFTGFEMVCSNSSKYPEILEDHTLGFVGAQNAEDVKYNGKEETIYIGSDENEPDVETKEETTKNTDADTNVSEILDDLFAMDEGSIQEETPTEEIKILHQEDKKEENTIIEENNTIKSIDDILDEVTIDTSIVSVDETPNLVTKEEEQDLQMIDDSLFIDVPQYSPETEKTQEDIQIISEEKTDPYAKEENVELIIDKENDNENKDNDDEIFEINEDQEEEELINIKSNEDEVVIEEDTSSIVLIEDELQEVYPTSDDFIINEEDETIENLDDEIIDEATMLSQEEPVQKVIVDYDENGEPIYSYITDIKHEEKSLDENELLLEDDNDNFLVYEDDNASVSEIEDISDDEDEEEYESVYADEEETDEESSKEIEENNDELEENKDIQEEIEYKDEEPLELYNDDDNEIEQPLVVTDNSKINNETMDDDISRDNNEFDSIDNNSDEEDNEYEEDDLDDNLDETEDEEDDDMIDYNDEDLEEDDNDEEGEYDDYDVEDHLPEEQIKKSSSLLGLIIAIIVLFGLIGGGVFFFLNKNKATQEEPSMENFNENVIETAESPAVNDMFEAPVETEQQDEIPVNQEENQNTENSMFEEQLPPPENNPVEEQTQKEEIPSLPELTESDLIKPVERKSNGDVNKTIINAFSTNTSPVSLRALNWFCASELFSEINFKNYLQTIDNSLKQNLRNNFMGLVESAPKDSVAAKFAVDKRGNIKKSIISESSGSTEIDNVVLQSINETFEQQKSQILNDNELKQDMYYLKVVIKL